MANAGGSWNSSNLWKFYAYCEVEFGCVNSAVTVLQTAASLPTSGQAELQEQLEKFVLMYQPENSERVLQEARQSEEVKSETAARSRYEQELHILKEAFDSSKEISRREVATWMAYLGHMHSRGGARPLFQRCLARCYQVEELWLYWAECELLPPQKLDVLYQARSFLPKSTGIGFMLAELEEEQGNFVQAHTILTNLAAVKPSTAGHKRLQLEQRKGSSVGVLKTVFQEVCTKISEVKEASEIAIKFSDIMIVKSDHQAAIEILECAIKAGVGYILNILVKNVIKS